MEFKRIFAIKISSDNILSTVKTSRIILIAILLYSTSFFWTYHYNLIPHRYSTIYHNNMKFISGENIKNILLWSKLYAPLNLLQEGNFEFVKGECSFTNCYLFDNSKYWNRAIDFDAILFGGVDIRSLTSKELPSERSCNQKYIFVASESADRFPICDPIYDGYFNRTWTYRLDSDFFWGYFIITDVNDKRIGPSLNMHWIDVYDPIDEELKSKLSKKSKTAAWFVSNCFTKNGRNRFVRKLQKYLKVYGRSVDVYGQCGPLSCPRDDEPSCFKKLEENYYFYLSFENSFAEDYVTEKLFNALNNYAVPIVYGAANYCRFLPPGSYLNARKLGPKELARLMNTIINDDTKYQEFFRWRNHYRYIQPSRSNNICELCTMLNDGAESYRMTVWKNFRSWWNGATFKKSCH